MVVMLKKWVPRWVLFLALFLLPASARAFAYQNADLGVGWKRTPPEPLGEHFPYQRDVRWLCVAGLLPLEVLQPLWLDRGELAASLGLDFGARGGLHLSRARSEPAWRRLAEYFFWERASWLAPLPTDPSRSRRGIVRLVDQDEFLLLEPYLQLAPEVAGQGGFSWTDSSRIGLLLTAGAGSGFCTRADVYAAEIVGARRYADPLVAGTDFVLACDEASVSARLGGVRLRAGRGTFTWGPGFTGGMLLSGTSEPFDYVSYAFRIGEDLRFEAVTGFTDMVRGRYLAAHRLGLNISSGLYVEVAEAARYQRGALHPLYLCGFVPYTIVERNDLKDGPQDSTRYTQRNNVMWDLQVRWRPKWRTLLYAEVLVDDVSTESSKMPSRFGVLVGGAASLNVVGKQLLIELEAAKVTNYTYSVYYQHDCLCDWEHGGKPLGYPLGPDVHLVAFRASLDLGNIVEGSLEVKGWQKGAGRIGKPWVPGMGASSPLGEWHLEDPVETRLNAGVTFKAHIARGCYLGLRVGYSYREEADGGRVHREALLKLLGGMGL